MSYAEAYQQSKNFAINISNHGALKNDVLALLLPNCLEFPIIFAGAAGAGMILTTMNPLGSRLEIARQLKISKAKLAITTEKLAPKLLEAIDSLGDSDKWKDRILITGDETG